MNFRNISSWCIRNPVPPIVLFVALLLAGLVSFMRMDVNNFPDIEFPAAIVTVSQPGAAPSEMETQITQRVEAAARGLTGIEEINSTIREGNSSTFVSFQIGTPIDRAVTDLRDAISQIRSELPEGILEPQITRIDAGEGDEMSFIAVQTTDMTLEQLSWYVDNDVARRLLAVPGLAAVTREGGVDRQVRVELEPAALQSYGITAAQVNQQLRQVNLNATGGRAEIAGSEQTVRVLGNATNAYGLSQTQIIVPGGRTVKLADLGRVYDGNSELRSAAYLGGKAVVSFNMSRARGSSEVSVYDAAWAELAKIEKEDPRVKFVEIDNTVDYTKNQYSSSMRALVEGAILAVLVVFLFLRDFRATIISAVAIPLSAIPAFWFMDLMDINLNFLSLLALALVAGVLVDDAIVEIENIVRHMRMGKSAYQASIDAADEIGLAVLATTMSIVAVFLPVALMPGISGQLFRHFGYTVVLAVLMSLLVARMITPLMAAYFLRAHGEQPHASGKWMQKYLGVLNWTLRHRWAALVAGLSALVLTGAVFSTLSMSFQPEQDVNNSTVRIAMPPGSTIAQTRDVANQTAEIVQRHPEVQHVFERVFTSVAFVNVRYRDERAKKSFEIEREITPNLARISDARVNFMSQGGGGPGSGGRPITLYLGGNDPVKLNAVANQIATEMEKIPELVAPRVQGDDVRPEIVITPHLDLAADLGVTTAALSQTIRIATIGDIAQNSAKFSLADRQVPIIVSLPESARRDLSTLENLPVPTASGGSVPLKSVAEVGFGSGPVNVQRTNQVRRIAIGADLAPGLVSGDAWTKINALPILENLPDGVQKLELGDQKWQQELFVSFGIALASGILLVFAVLVLLYRRFLAPFVNMGSLLLAPLGAVIALKIAGMPVSLPVFIGILMLFGIVAKNSILLVDFAVEMMNHGMGKDEAIYEAGHKRAQPIVMTTIAMVAGMLPVAMSLHGDSSWRAPMGVTVIGGLLFSTLLTLLLVPAYFSLAIDVEQWIGRKFQKFKDREHLAAPGATGDGRPPLATPAE